MKVADRVRFNTKALIEKKGTSISEVASKIGISRPYLSQALAGARKINTDLIDDLARVLQVDVSKLVEKPKDLLRT